MTVHITPGPDGKRDTGDRRWLWCFRCRQRTIHRYVVLYDTPPSYYDPELIRECSACGGDRTRFGEAA